MNVICEHCKKPIEQKDDLLVMTQWWLFPRALHKACWGNLASANAGVGSVSYQTGALQRKRRQHIAINSGFFWLIVLISLVLAAFVLMYDFQTVGTTGQTQPLDAMTALIVKVVLVGILLIPVVQKLYSRSRFEKPLSIN